MRTIGLIGGMSWESTTLYYRLINQGVQQALGGLHSARIILYSVDFAPIEQLQQEGDWAGAAALLAQAAQALQAGGADFLLLCTNTMHRVAREIQEAVQIPLIHIADATAEDLQAHSIQRVALLGTAFTMEQDFYSGILRHGYGMEVLIPGEEDRALVHRVIYDELCRGRAEPDSKARYLRIIEALSRQGAQGVILGCTEIGLLVKQEDTAVQLFDTAAIHARKAVKPALA